VHRLLVEEQQDGGADVAAGDATAAAGTATPAPRSAVRTSASARVALAGGEVLGRVVELVTGRVPALHGMHVMLLLCR